MTAGDSAAAESRRLRAVAEAHTQAANDAYAKSQNFEVASRTEKKTAFILSALEPAGYTLLEDRYWPSSRHAQVDLVLVGPGGVFIVDTKAWAEASVVGGRIYRGQEDATDELENLSALAEVTEEDLSVIGLAPGEVRVIAAMACQPGIDAWVGDVHVVGQDAVLRVISRHGQRLAPENVERVLARAESLFGPVKAPAPISTLLPDPVMPLDPEPLQEPLLTVDEVHSAILDVELAKPIEGWMAFLHPTQARLVHRTFPGPSRVRGPAGTGKTVVGLHRAAYLARRRPGKVLVTTFVRTLPHVLRSLLGTLAPDIVDKVEFTGVHAFARGLLTERGVEVRVDPDGAKAAFSRAWERVGRPSSLGASAKGENYWKEELEYVLKGRGITTFEQYASLTRTGRRYPLPASMRRDVWALYVAYEAELRGRRIHDYSDLVLLAEKSLQEEPLTGYSAVIVDEAQDLTCAMIRLLHLLVGDAPDGLTLIGDGQQSIYPGGYTLAEAGVSVANRGVVLDINYRNTHEIVTFAQRLVAADDYADIEGLSGRDKVLSVPRHGPTPTVENFARTRDARSAMVARVKEVVASHRATLGDIAVLCTTRRDAGLAGEALSRAGVRVIDLEAYTGSPVEAVKIGTVKRAKGLEFKRVLLPDIRRHQTGATPPADEAAHERWSLYQRELYVAMTRARDELWVGISA